MRWRSTSFVVFVACAALPGAASASHSNGQGPGGDRVHGTGQAVVEITAGTQTASFHVNARSGPAGEAPVGHLWLDLQLDGEAQVDLRARVTCLTAAGNAATVGGEIERGELAGQPLAGAGVLFDFRDNGSGSAAPPDQSNARLLTAAPTACPPPPILLQFPFGQGNFVVHDAASAP